MSIATTLVCAVVFVLSSGFARVGLLVGVISLQCVLATLGVMKPHWQFFGRSLCRAKVERKQVALTFDDGPDPETTPALLELLARRGVRATFFCIGERVARHPEIVQRMTAEGHEVANHSHRHSPLTNLFSLARLRQELTEAQREIARVSGRVPRFFRPPMGLTNPAVFLVGRELGLTVTGWSTRGFDRRADLPARIVGRILRRVGPGAIILLHDGGVPAARLLAVAEMLIDKLGAQGYQSVRLDALVAGEATA
jgi:peptidoglycan-N-acetylglucosamine deacetylase